MKTIRVGDTVISKRDNIHLTKGKKYKITKITDNRYFLKSDISNNGFIFKESFENFFEYPKRKYLYKEAHLCFFFYLFL